MSREQAAQKGRKAKNNVLVSVQDDIAEPAWIARVAPFELALLERLGYGGEEISVLFCGDGFIRGLNREYRGIDSPTDVLSFGDGEPYTDESGAEWRSMGDIVISLDAVPRNAVQFGVPEDEELKRLLVHGTLHLNGLDHGEEHIERGVPPTCEMLRLQERIMRELRGERILL